MSKHFAVDNSFAEFTVAVDFDGCLVYDSGETNRRLVKMLKRLQSDGIDIVIFSARPPSNTRLVREWCRSVELDAEIMLGTKPAADAFIDDRGLLPPLEVLESYIQRLRSARDVNDLTLGRDPGPLSEQMAQCWENPDAVPVEHDPRFGIWVPVSAGVDSTTCWTMALAAGLPVEPVYVDTGASYADAEWDAVLRLYELLGGNPPERRRIDVEYQRWQHVDRARNAVIVLACAEDITVSGGWGEIWFGNVAEWAETPVRGGDKSHRWLLTMQQLLTLEGHDVRLSSPLGGMSKTDCAIWMVSNERLAVLQSTRSCYSGEASEHCGRCRSCFRRWLALEPLTLNDIFAWGPTQLDFKEQAESFLNDLARNHDKSVEWSTERTGRIAQDAMKWLRY